MVDHQFHRLLRIDQLRIAAELGHGVAHRRQIDHRRHAGEVLQQHPGGGKGDFLLRRGLRLPTGKRPDIIGGDGDSVLVAQQILEQDAQRIGEPVDGESGLRQRRQPEDFVLPVTDLKRRAGREAILHDFLRLPMDVKWNAVSLKTNGICATPKWQILLYSTQSPPTVQSASRQAPAKRLAIVPDTRQNRVSD